VVLDQRTDRVGADDLKARIAELGRPLRVLIAEDDATNRMVVVKMLQEFTTETRIATDGVQAVQAAAEADYDLVLMDVRMPEMDGLAATRAIRARGVRFAALPIIALTANAFAEDIKLCRDAGMSDFLAKPLRKQAMVAAMLRAIGRVAIPAAASPAEPAATVPVCFDRTALAHLTAAIGEDGVQETFAVFARGTEARIALFRQFTEGNDRQLIEIEAHALKGSAGTLGASEVSDIARLIEHGRQASAPTSCEARSTGWTRPIARCAGSSRQISWRSPRTSGAGLGRDTPIKPVHSIQIEKLVPQPQDAVALGLTTRNDAPIRSSTKSTSDPARNGTEAGSTSTTALSRAITRSSSACARSTSNLY